MKTITVGSCVALVSSICLILVSQWVFAPKESDISFKDLVWPPSSGWIGCIVVGILVGEYVRRLLERRRERAGHE
jgi:hypothetical protein